MTITVKVLGEGQLLATKQSLYTVPAGSKGYVKFLSLYNTSSLLQEAHIFLKTAGISRQITRVELEPGGSARVVDKDEAITLEEGDIIEGYADRASEVDYVITGAEEV